MTGSTLREIMQTLDRAQEILVLPYDEMTLAGQMEANALARRLGDEQGASDYGNGGEPGDDVRYYRYVVEPACAGLSPEADAEVFEFWTREEEAEDPRAEAFLRAFYASFRAAREEAEEEIAAEEALRAAESEGR